MSCKKRKAQAQDFPLIDVRLLHGNFFPGLKQKAVGLEVGEGFTVIQTFEPHPLYAAMEALGFEHHTEQAGPAEFRVSFCRVEKKDGGDDTPFQPLALLNYPMIDEELGRIAADFWSLTWQSGKRTLPYETRLLLSWPMPWAPDGCGRPPGSWSRPMYAGWSLQLWTMCLNCWPGTRGSAISVQRSAPPPYFKPIR